MRSQKPASGVSGVRSRGLNFTEIRQRAIGSIWWLAILAAAGTLVASRRLDWIPGDDGFLLQAAQRVRSGEVPHVDFHEPYTGALDYLNSATISAFGDSMASLRWPFLLGALLWLWCLFLIARRFLPRMLAGPLVGSFGVGSVLLHMSPIPTWYNLFLGTTAVYCAIRYLEDRSLRWVGLAGLLTGLSIILKVSGAFFAVAIAVGLVAIVGAGATRSRKYVVVASSAAGFCFALYVVSFDFTINRGLALLLPIFLVLWRLRPASWSSEGTSSGVAKPVMWLTLSTLTVVAGWVGIYLVRGYLSDLVTGVYRIPGLYSRILSVDQAGIANLALPVVLFGVLRLAIHRDLDLLRGLVIGLGGAFLTFLVDPAFVLITIHNSLAYLALVAAILLLLQTRPLALADRGDAALILLTLAAVYFSLITIPHAGPYYYIFAYPLPALAIAGWAYRWRADVGIVVAVLFVVAGAFFGIAKLRGQWFATGTEGVTAVRVELSSEHGGVLVHEHFDFYNSVIESVNAKVADGKVVLVGPDSPEIYSLTELENSTPVMFENISQAVDPSYSAKNIFLTSDPDFYFLNTGFIANPAQVAEMKIVLRDCVKTDEMGYFEVYDCRRQ